MFHVTLLGGRDGKPHAEQIANPFSSAEAAVGATRDLKAVGYRGPFHAITGYRVCGADKKVVEEGPL